jgi:hypothetical protein
MRRGTIRIGVRVGITLLTHAVTMILVVRRLGWRGIVAGMVIWRWVGIGGLDRDARGETTTWLMWAQVGPRHFMSFTAKWTPRRYPSLY